MYVFITQVKDEPVSPKKNDPTRSNITTRTDQTSSMKLPPYQPSSQISDDNSGYDSDSSSFDEFSFTCDIQQNEREGPQSDMQQ